MILNEPKMKLLLVNFTKNYQFATRIKLNNTNIQQVNQVKILGTIISEDFSWNANCENIIKKCNMRMQLLQTVASFGANERDLKHIYIQFIRTILEGSCQVWYSGLTKKNISDLERCQKSAVKIISQNYTTYKKTLKSLNMDTLKSRYEMLTLRFATNAITHDKLKHFFPLNKKTHHMKTRKTEVFQKIHTLTERYEKSPIVHMQKILNEKIIK